jgi:DNA-binding NtrC family response regulator
MTDAVANVLVVDDEESIRLGCEQTLAAEGHRVRTAADGKTALALAREEAFDVAILDLRMPGLGGLEVLAALRRDSPETEIIVVTGYATIESAVEAMRRGAYDYLAKPFGPDLLVAVVTRAFERRRLAMENAALRVALREREPSLALVGASSAMEGVLRLVQKVAPTDATVLVLGETGVGKEVTARAVHQASLRREHPFVAVDCAALVEGLFESELFGHVRGAFTGAVETRVGKFELAHGGTLFLDEIGNLGEDMQVKLLRALQEREITKVGGTQRVKVDVRVIAATNADLVTRVREGAFREDLFYRLSVVPIVVPPLRDRREDVPLLARHFLQKYGARRNRTVTSFGSAALRALEAHEWPGNVRELENTVERALVMCESSVIEPEDLLFYGPGTLAASAPAEGDEAGPGRSGEGHLADVERREIAAALERFDGQIARAAQFLGINRKTLREKLRRYGRTR